MSSVSGVSSSNSQVLLQYILDQLTQTGTDSTGSASAGAAGSASVTPANFQVSPSSTNGTGTSDSGTTTSFQQQIESAVTTALQNYNPATSSSNVFQVIQNAITSTLQANGIDPAQLQQQSGTGQHHHHHHHGGGQQAAGSGSSSQQSPQSLLEQWLDSLNSPAGPTTSDGQTTSGQTLAAQPLSAIVSGSIDPSSQNSSLLSLTQLLTSLPPGSGVDVQT